MGWGEKNKERGRKKEGTEGWGTKGEIRQMDLNGERESIHSDGHQSGKTWVLLFTLLEDELGSVCHSSKMRNMVCLVFLQDCIQV